MQRDFWIGLGLLGFSLICLFFLVPAQVGAFDSPATLMPLVALVVLALLSALLSLQGARPRPRSQEVSESGSTDSAPRRAAVLASIVAIMLGYAWLLDWTGFLLTAFIALACLLVLAGVRGPLRIGIVSLGVVVALYLVFDILLKAPLPEGVLIEQLLH